MIRGRWVVCVFLAVALVLSLSSCSSGGSGGGGSAGSGGSGGGAGNCGNAPCGGNLVGTWSVQNICYPGSESVNITNCSPATVTTKSQTLTGTLHFDTNGTWQTSFSGQFSAHVVMAQGCLDANQCQQFQTSLQGESGITSATCSYGTTCACDYAGSDTSSDTGSYQISGTSVIISTDGSTGSPATDGYCVSGNTLTLTESANGGTSSIVFTRQG